MHILHFRICYSNFQHVYMSNAINTKYYEIKSHHRVNVALLFGFILFGPEMHGKCFPNEFIH